MQISQWYQLLPTSNSSPASIESHTDDTNEGSRGNRVLSQSTNTIDNSSNGQNNTGHNTGNSSRYNSINNSSNNSSSKRSDNSRIIGEKEVEASIFVPIPRIAIKLQVR